MSNESENTICEHEEFVWIDQEYRFLGCSTCNGSMQIETWRCLSCGEVGTSEREAHDAGHPCNPIEWKRPLSEALDE
jgi:hypothetical protein